jgi:hypothetical protein
LQINDISDRGHIFDIAENQPITPGANSAEMCSAATRSRDGKAGRADCGFAAGGQTLVSSSCQLD